MSKARTRTTAPAARSRNGPGYAARGSVGSGRLLPWLVAGAVVLAGLALAGLVVLGGGDGSARSGANLRLVAYQGAEVIGGSRTDLATIRGQGKPIVLNFFAGLCPPCRGEMPGFQAVWERHQGQIIVVGADIGPYLALGSHADAERLLDELDITYPAAYVEDNPVQQWDIVGMPTTVLYDATGREVGRHTGFMTEEQLDREVQSLIATARR